MKIAIVLCAIVAAVIAAPFASKPDDFRNEFDRLMVIAIQERFADVEHFLARLTHQLVELEKSKSKAVKDQILLEIDTSLNLLAGAKVHLERELKRTDLNFLEKFNLDEILATGTVLYKDLEETQKHVKAVKTDAAEEGEVSRTDKDELREEFDRLLVAVTMDHFHKLEQAMFNLSNQVIEFENTKSKTMKAEIIREISLALDFIAIAKGHIERELQRPDLNLLEKYNFEATLATGVVLTRDLTTLEKHVKSIEAQ
uniref:Gly d 5.01 n=1 Tax=Glycyphagus domesticus TaxID=105145 RepID=Q1M2M7_GLYDO|nr:Gly d 5.01 [Glycyphagus domesticus]